MKLFALIIFSAVLCFGQAAFVANQGASVASPQSGQSCTSSGCSVSINTSTCGAHCLVRVCVGNYPEPSAGAVTDNLGNSYIRSHAKNEDGDAWVAAYDSIGGSVSATQVITVSGVTQAAMSAIAISGIASGPDQPNQSGGFSSNPFTTGPITPTNPNEAILSCASNNGNNVNMSSVGSPFTLLDNLASVYFNNTGVASAYEIQTTATTVNAGWNLSTSGTGTAAIIDSYYSVESPASLSVTTTSLPEGFNGVAYSASLQAIGGVAAYTWSCTSAGCAAALAALGLSLNTATGVISGTGITGSTSGFIFQVTDSQSTTASTGSITLTIASAQLSITTSTCAGGTQYASYSGCTISATGGTSPYTFTWSGNAEGLALNSSTGAITSSFIGGQGIYAPTITVTDSLGATVSKTSITFSMLQVNGWMAGIFPSNAIFYHRMDAASTSLPVSTSPADQITTFAASKIQPFFGTAGGNGIPAIEVPYNQADVAVNVFFYQCYFGTFVNGPYPCSGSSTAPIPSYVPVEDVASVGCCNSLGTGGNGDAHAVVYVEAGGGNPAALYESWNTAPCVYASQLGVSAYCGGSAVFTEGSNALWSNTGTNAMITNGTTDASGSPLLPYLLTPEEVIGTGTPTSPNGAVKHITRATFHQTLAYQEWPATAHSGVGTCYSTPGSGSPIPHGLLSQSSPPDHCTAVNTGEPAMGVIFRLKASVYSSLPACFATSPQAAIIATGLYQYGIINTDNGTSIGVIGTPSPQWVAADLLCLKQLVGANFEPVNVSSLIVSNNSFQAGSGTGTAPTITSSCPTSTATQGVSYSFTMTATGTTPITFGVLSGSLPSGLSLNTSTGMISGTPFGSGTSSFTLEAINGVSPNATQPCSISVVSVAPTIPAAGSIFSAGWVP